MSRKEKTIITGTAFDYKLVKRIFSYVIPYRKIFFLSIFFILALALISPLRPILVQHAIDDFIPGKDLNSLMKVSGLMILILGLESFFQFFDRYYANLLGQSVVKDLRVKLFNHLTGFRLKFFDNTPIGTLVTRSISDIQTIADVFSEGFLEIVGDILKLVIIIAVMLMTDLDLTLISLSTIPILLLATYIFKNAVRAAFQEVRTQVARLSAFVQEHITGMKIVQVFNREAREMDSFSKINKLHLDANVRSVFYYAVFFPVVEILSAISIGLLVWWGARGALTGDVSPGNIVAFLMYISMLFRPIRQLADRFNTLQMGMVGAERVFKLLDTRDEIIDQGKATADNMEGNVEFKDVWFAYNNEDWVLKDISFKASKGETIAFVGATGAGKSSIISLVNRFYEYNKGEIIIDGKNITEFELNSLRKKIGLVLQDVFLFSDTIANNITLNNPEISNEKIVEAAKAVGAHDFISRLPGGYDFNVMERGGMLSMGERQLISFIRAYVYDPSILILDEATSSIDSETERLIQKATAVLTKNRTSIIIAHRLATIQKADRIIVLEKGKIIESGKHNELLELNGHYRSLFELQFREALVS